MPRGPKETPLIDKSKMTTKLLQTHQHYAMVLNVPKVVEQSPCQLLVIVGDSLAFLQQLESTNVACMMQALRMVDGVVEAAN